MTRAVFTVAANKTNSPAVQGFPTSSEHVSSSTGGTSAALTAATRRATVTPHRRQDSQGVAAVQVGGDRPAVMINPPSNAAMASGARHFSLPGMVKPSPESPR